MKRLISIEGCDGSGKHTQSIMLAEAIQGSELISFPEYESDTGNIIKKYLTGKYGEIDSLSPFTTSAMYALDRSMSFNTNDWGKNFYTESNTVIADRYIHSNIIHQASKCAVAPIHKFDTVEVRINQHTSVFMEINELVNKILNLDKMFGVPEPDIVIYLDMPVDISVKLMTERYHGDECAKDIHESDINYLRNCNAVGRYLMTMLNAKIVNCTNADGELRSQKDIHEEIIKLIN